MITERIAAFTSRIGAGEIPPEALAKARLGITDFIGVALAGSQEECGRLIRGYAARMGGSATASLIAGGRRTSPELAALVNGTIGHALDYDDMSVAPISHPSAFLVPAILAVAESTGASGLEALAAYVVGYEVASCIAEPVFQSHYLQGWHSTSTFGSLGAAAAVCWLLKLKPGQVATALGIAASLACGLRQNFGTMTKPLHAGRAGGNGVQAAFLAQAGFTADRAILEAPLGFARVMGHPGGIDWSGTAEALGRRFVIAGPQGLAIKPYPSCGFTHTAIDCALELRRQGIVADQVAAIELGTSPFDAQLLIHHRPATGLEAKFSLEYCVARTLVSGPPRLDAFSDAAVSDPDVRRLIDATRWVERFPMPVMGTPEGFGTKSVAVTLMSGERHEAQLRVARGMPTRPLDEAEFRAKYRDCASRALPEEAVETSWSLLAALERARGLGPIMRQVARAEGRDRQAGPRRARLGKQSA